MSLNRAKRTVIFSGATSRNILALRAHGLQPKMLAAMGAPPTLTMNATPNANSTVVPANYNAGFHADDATAFTYLGGYSVNQATGGEPGPTWQVGRGANWGTGNGPYQGTFSAYFQTDSTDVDLSLIAKNTIDATYRISIDLIDGNGFKATALAPRTDIQTLADFSGHRVKIANGSVALRRYRVECDHFIYFAGVDVTAGKTVAAYNPAPNGPRILVTGDSHVAATGATSRLLGMSMLLQQYLGVYDVESQGVPGTGYLATGAAGTETMRARVPNEITPRVPTLIIDLGGYNDSASTAGQLTTEVGLYYAALTAALPGVPVIKIGPPRRGVSPTFTLAQAKWDAIRNAVAADARYGRYVFNIDSYAADWEHGTGHVGATASDGNADTWVGADNIHRTDTGHVGWAALMGPAIRAVFGL